MERVVTAISCRRVAMRVADAEAAESWILAILAVSAIDAGIKKVEKVRKSPKKSEKDRKAFQKGIIVSFSAISEGRL